MHHEWNQSKLRHVGEGRFSLFLLSSFGWHLKWHKVDYQEKKIKGINIHIGNPISMKNSKNNQARWGICWQNISQSKKEMENFIWAKFEDYNLGRAFQKALRTVPPIRSQDAVYIDFLTEGCTWNDAVLLTVYIIQIRCHYGELCDPPYKIKKKCYLLKSCLVGSSVAGRGTLFGAQEWALVSHFEMNCLRDTCADKARDFIGKGHPGREQEGGNPGELLCHVTYSLGFYGDGVSFWLVSDLGPLLVARASLSQDGFQRGVFWKSLGLVSPLSFWYLPSSSRWC